MIVSKKYLLDRNYDNILLGNNDFQILVPIPDFDLAHLIIVEDPKSFNREEKTKRFARISGSFNLYANDDVIIDENIIERFDEESIYDIYYQGSDVLFVSMKGYL